MMLMLYSLLDDADSADPYRDLPLGKRKVPCCLFVLYLLKMVILFPFAVLGLLFMSSDKRNVLHLDESKRVSTKANDSRPSMNTLFWSKPLSLTAIKRLRKRAKCSVNDLLSSLIAGSLRRYFQDIGESVDHDVTCVIPVSVRRLGSKTLKINNQVSSVFLRLPISVSEPSERLKVTKRRMNMLKSGAMVWAVFVMTHFVALLPRRLARFLNRRFINKCSLIFSNVPGKSTPSSVLGNNIMGVLGVVPLSGDLGAGVTCITYAGHAFLTVQGHRGMRKAELIAKYFIEEFHALQRALGDDDIDEEEDSMTQLQLRQAHAGWLRDPRERSDVAKGMVPCYVPLKTRVRELIEKRGLAAETSSTMKYAPPPSPVHRRK